MEHGSLLDEETAELMEKKDVYLGPTCGPVDEIIRMDEENLARKPLEFQTKLRQYADRLKRGRKL